MKTIFITGGTSGIGKCIALSSLRNGHRVIVIGSSDASVYILYNETKK